MENSQNTDTSTEAGQKTKIQKKARPSNVVKELRYLRAWLNREWRAFCYFIGQIPLKIKVGISRILIRTGNRLNKSIRLLDSYVTQYAFNPNANKYEDLAPIDSADDDRRYIDMLLWGLKNPKVTNIAITGPYGSGKSSVIRTFQKQHSEFRSVNVSLASFNEEKDADGEWRNKVELSILQQLIYHERSNDLPDSRFVKIRPIRWYNRLIGTVFLGVLILSYLYVTKTQYFSEFNFIDDKIKPVLSILFPAILIFGSMYILYRLYHTIRNLRFTKLSIISADAEISDREARSVFNKHLDEIIYFFETTRVKLVVIEDLDRFKDPEIFTKLREINILINNSKQIKHRVTFLYAVRDNIFKNNDRTKFFEVIIPIIPVISVSNAGDALSTKLRTVIPNRPISQELSKAVSLYIQDMRMLLNITNEFILYLKQLSSELDHEKLLSLIIFKNLHPKDFANLHRGKGMIINVLEGKRRYITEQKERNYSYITDLQKKIKEIQSLKIKDIVELRSLYIYKAISKIPYKGYLEFNEKTNLSDFVEDETFQWWQNGGKPKVYEFAGYSAIQLHSIDCSFALIEKEVDSENSYLNREELINSFHNSEIDVIKTKIDVLTKETTVITGKSLKEILDSGKGFEFPKDNYISPILVYLMSTGYIDEYYHPYISHFIEGSLSESDMSFVMSVLNRQPLIHSHKLTNVSVIHKEWLSIGQYSNKAILNFDLLNWLLQQESCEEELRSIFGLVKQREDITFINDFLKLNRNQDELIRYLGSYWPEFWDYLYEESFYGDEILAQYASLIIQHLSLKRISTDIDKNKKFSLFMSIISSLYKPELMQQKQNTLVQVIDKLEIKYDNLTILESLPTALDAVYQKNSYTINLRNLEYIIKNYGGYEAFPKQDWNVAKLTVILSSKANYLTNYIKSHLETYLVLVKNNDLNTKENEKTMIVVLNNEETNIETVKKFIEKQEVIISSIEDVPERYWDFLFEKRKIEPNWVNINNYFIHKGKLEDILTSYLNDPSVYLTLKKTVFDINFNSDDEVNIIQEILYKDELSLKSYSSLLPYLTFDPDEIEIDRLSEDKITYLITNSRISFSSDTFSKIQSNYPRIIPLYIEANIDIFIENLSELSIEDETFVEVIDSKSINEENKARLIQEILKNYNIENNKLGSIIIDFLSQYQAWPNFIDINDTIDLFKTGFHTTVKIRALTPIVTKLSKETYKEIESTFIPSYNQITQNDTTQRSFKNFIGLKSFIDNVRILFHNRIGIVKESPEKITLYYKK